MERAKQIAEAYKLHHKNIGEQTPKMAFIAGAQWADENPVSSWKNIKEQKPKIGKYCLFTIVDSNGSFNALGSFRKGKSFFYVDNWHGGITLHDDYKVYWLAIPDLKL